MSITKSFFYLFNRVRRSLEWRLGRFLMSVNGVTYGKDLIVRGRLFLNVGAEANVSIGDGCVFSSGAGLNPLSRNIMASITVEDNASLRIGHGCGFSSCCLWAHEDITIGNNVNIGADTLIFDSDAHSLSFIDRRDIVLDMANKMNSPIVIKDDVLVGTRCIIMKGVTIGARSIVGSGSVVVGDIPDDCIAAGNPARVVKRLYVFKAEV